MMIPRILLTIGLAVFLGGQTIAAPQAVRTKVIRGGEAAHAISADVTGIDDLYLVAHIGPDTYNHDQAIWAEPKLIDPSGQITDMTTLKPAAANVGWGQFKVNGAHTGGGLNIAGQKFEKGFYAHAPSVLHFKLGGKFAKFEARVGIASGSGKNGSVEFEVTRVAPKLAAPKPSGPVAVPVKLAPAEQSPHQFNPAAARQLLAEGIDKLVFVRRFTLTCSHVYTEHVDARWTPGGGLCVLDLKSGAVKDLLPDMSGGVTNRFDVSYDGKKIVFDHKSGAKEGYRIYEVNADGTGLRQLTFPTADEEQFLKRYGRQTNDMHPCYLPDGDIVFTSTRCQSSVLCDAGDNFTTTVLHRMSGEGQNIRRLSSNTLPEFSPAVMPDGRILYMRWEYNRKGAGAVKCLWSMLPDGTATTEVYGNNIVDPETMLYGRPIPGTTDKISFLGCSHWGPNNGVGTVIVLDTNKDTRSSEAMRVITKDVEARTHGGYSFLVDGKWVNDSSGAPGRLFKDPYPLSEKLFLVAHKPKGLPWHDPKGYDLSVVDEEGRETVLYRDEQVSCWHPYPLRARPMPPAPATAVKEELAKKQLAQCVVADVYRGMEGVERGSVKYLRLMEQTPRPWAARARWAGDKQAMAHSALGPNLLGMQAQHGIVPVEEDGSANFYVPAGRNIYFQALDQEYRAIQTERTYVNYQAGEVRGCVGCHERGGTLGTASARALQRAPSMPGAQPGDSRAQKVFDYEREIQPIWNRHCISCHNGSVEKDPSRLNLSGELTDLHNVSYENLMGFGAGKARGGKFALVGAQANENDIRAFVEYTPPFYFGAYSSLLLASIDSFEPSFAHYGANGAAMKQRMKEVRAKHAEVKLSREELIRVSNWLDASCQYYPSYWGQKHVQHRSSPYFRPAVTFEEALSPKWPEGLKGLYENGASGK